MNTELANSQPSEGVPFTIRFPQVDPAGIIFYPRHIEMVLRAFPAFPFTEPPFAIRTNYVRPNRLGDRIQLRHEPGTASDDWQVGGYHDDKLCFTVGPLAETDDMQPNASLRRVSAQTIGTWSAGPDGRLQLSRYFELMNMAVEEWFEDILEMPFHEMHVGRRVGIPTVRFDTVVEELPAVGQIVYFEIGCEAIGNSTLTLYNRMLGDDKCFVSNRQVVVCVEMLRDNYQKIDVPDFVRNPLSGLVT